MHKCNNHITKCEILLSNFDDVSATKQRIIQIFISCCMYDVNKLSPRSREYDNFPQCMKFIMLRVILDASKLCREKDLHK